jgi:hypothetical protein
MTFQPSTYSHAYGGDDKFSSAGSDSSSDSGSSGGGGQDWSAIADAASAFASVGVSALSARSLQKSQLAHDEKMSESNARLAALQGKQAGAEAASARAQAVLASIGGQKTLLVVGGLVLTVGLIATTVIVMRRSS